MRAEHGGVHPGLARGQHQGQDLDAVFQQHGKALARLQALGRQPLRHLQRLLRQRAGGAAAALFGQNYHHPVGGRLCAAKEVLHACHPLFVGAPPRWRCAVKYEMPVS